MNENETIAAPIVPPTVESVVRLSEIRVVIDPPAYAYGWGNITMEEKAKNLERWAKEVTAFFRDHRSQDPVHIRVERVMAEVCTKCGKPWELAHDADGDYCAWCGGTIHKSNPSLHLMAHETTKGG